MALTEEQKSVARKVAMGMDDEVGLSQRTTGWWPVRFAERFLAALPKPEPMCTAAMLDQWFLAKSGIDPTTPLYTEASIAPPASAPSEQKQPWPNHNWCVGCSPDNCSGCGTEPIERRAPQPEQENYKAQRDALLKSLEEALECGEDGDWQSARRVLVSAIASVKGGAG